MEKQRDKPVPIRIRLILEIQTLAAKAKECGKELSVEKLIGEYMIKEGIARRLTMECINAIGHSDRFMFGIDSEGNKTIRLR